MLIEGSKSEDRIVRLGKNRNGPSDATFAFSIEVEDLGTDEDGDAITAPVAIEVDPGGVKPNREVKLGDKPALLLRTLRDMDPSLFEQVKPAPDLPTVAGIRRDALRSTLIGQGWFAENMLCTSVSPPKLADAGHNVESNAPISLKRRNFINFNRNWVWPI